MDEPPVKLLIRTGGGGPYQFRNENEWPLARTQWTRFYLKAGGRSFGGCEIGRRQARPGCACRLEIGDLRRHRHGERRRGRDRFVDDARRRASRIAWGFRSRPQPLAADTEVTGPINLVLWVSSTSEDMDLFATIRNIDAAGQRRLGDRPAGTAGAGRERVAARVAARARSRAFTAASPVSQAHPASSPDAGRTGRVPGRDLAYVHGLQERPSHPARHPASRRRRAARRIRTTTATTTRGRTRCTRAAIKLRTCFFPIIPHKTRRQRRGGLRCAPPPCEGNHMTEAAHQSPRPRSVHRPRVRSGRRSARRREDHRRADDARGRERLRRPRRLPPAAVHPPHQGRRGQRAAEHPHRARSRGDGARERRQRHGPSRHALRDARSRSRRRRRRASRGSARTGATTRDRRRSTRACRSSTT